MAVTILLASFVGCASTPTQHEGTPQPKPSGSGGRGTSPGLKAHMENSNS